jgi:phospholipid/cholesterol/gamma-HCH transport system permease protein
MSLSRAAHPLPSDNVWMRLIRESVAFSREQWRTSLDIAHLFLQTFARALRIECWRWNEICDGIVKIGVGSLPIITVSTAFAGLVVTNEIAWHMDRALHTVQMIPGFTGQFILRELGIAIPALLLVAKVGASITAEVGSMKVTEQIDALKLLGIDPINYLVFPRFVASIFSAACLVLISAGITLGCAIFVAITHYNFGFGEYMNALRHFVGVKDVVCALVKGTVYGAVIPVVSCAYGFRCKGGAEGVGTATTNSVVASTILVISLDFVLTYVFTKIL